MALLPLVDGRKGANPASGRPSSIFVSRLHRLLNAIGRRRRARMAVHVRSAMRGRQAASLSTGRFGAGRAWVAYSVSPVKAIPPTRLPSTVGISFQIK